MSEWRNRIVKHGAMAADQFLANPRNPRKHPQKQRDAVRGSLDTLGWIAPVIVNARTGYMIDGHERVWQAMQNGNAEVPYIEVDLSEDEESLALATFDWITYMAEYDRESLGALLQDVNTDNAALQTIITQLAAQSGVVPPDDPYAEWQGMPEFEQETNGIFHTVKVHFETEQDLISFSRLINQTITDKTKYIYFPKQKRADLKQYAVIDDES